MKIIYLQDNGVIAIISLVDESNIVEEASKHVPLGKKFKIIADNDFPVDTKYRDAWTVNESDLTDGIGAME
ncbi:MULTISPECIES: hypothetical protein [Acinetobacter calcoaceticus/baumannii complex]|uniref:hypothetical protein n=1 Tax=Acinetobacter calcoaceticus/baumannii complex TaxID=909768 RepID=UPI0012390A1B|nr:MULTISPECIES: hypothetical protein [Acinetobacter calcoaceticus/baumannii complex]MDE3318766.1 hypothetical protein [Acinetobacter baumannii]MDX2337579.1 hypothetical protein [Acinetobacter baumannii]MDX5549333.1 hypothetical protein [Acinetobacter baumannii]HAV4952368.1 hypothetical protein [Acinetobacter baumannii]